MSTILVCDAERAVLHALEVNLKARGHVAYTASTGAECLALAARHHPDAVIADVDLPDLDGMEVIEGIRGWTELPIIVLSARCHEADKVRALDAGANDFVSKPFGMDELMARLRVALRRTPAPEELPIIETRDFVLDLPARRVRNTERVVRLTATEWRIVEILALHPGRLVTNRQLLDQVWGLKGTKTNHIRVAMVSIRRKLEPEPSCPRYFITEPRAGLRFVPEGQRDRVPARGRALRPGRT